MTTSGVTAWSLTVLDTIKAAMEELGLLDPSTDPEADEVVTAIRLLNGYLKSLQLRGVSLAREATGTVTTLAASPSGSLDPAVRTILSARLVVSATQERPLFPMTRTDYLNLPNKLSVGSPTMYYLSRQSAAPVLYLWPVSATAVTVKIDYDKIIETVTAVSETLDIRSELHEMVWTNLAVKMGPAFGQPVPQSVAMRAMMLEQQMLDAERPDAYRFETDYDYA